MKRFHSVDILNVHIFFQMLMISSCDTNGGEEESGLVIGRKARGKETTRKTEK
jgi:hypothetical protein